MIFAELLTKAKKLNNYLEGSANWDSTTEHKYTVPAGKRWFVINGSIDRDVSSTLNVYIKDSADKVIFELLSESAATGYSSMITDGANTLMRYKTAGTPLILDEDEYCHIVCGTAQSTAVKSSFMVLEVGI